MDKAEYEPGTPCWVDLMTTDVEASAGFYRELFGWNVVDQGAEFGGYRICDLGGKPVAGIGAAQAGMPPAWLTYVAVQDADVATKAVTAAGGQVLAEPMEIPRRGRMAVFADPAGAVFGVWEPRGFTGAALVNETGTLGWNELATRRTDTAGTFYHAVFGWEPAEQRMGEMSYTEWKLGGTSIGGMMAMDPAMPAEVPSYWSVYFIVDDADATVARATELGGGVVVPATDIPPGRFAVLTDPQGAAFSVIRPNPMPGA
ncbi:VOC family protein [Amycolatopsis sp.]|uniref:VOC family protein n=1 Tax=Amycolatopsis sp. TaxID=37632 RepID=UPI002CD744E8|nr:VOC family protein [Amycolatopsis sp.]HVV13408.1 VOC family protein [Amycolatopsis sp.]